MSEDVTLRDYVDVRFNDIERAARVATEAAEKRLDGMNKFREALSDQQRTLLTRAEYDAYHNGLVARVTELEAARNDLAGRDKATARATSMIISVVAILVSIIGTVISMWHR